MKEPNPKDNSFLEETSEIRESDILSQLTEDKGPSLFLGRYSMNEVISVLGKRNFLKEAQKRNLWPLSFDLDSSEYPLQRFQIFYREKDPKKMIVDLKIREGRFRVKDEFASGFLSSEYEFLILEWLTLQNPLQDFSPERAPLPGQNYPGLSLGKKVLDIFVYLARLTKKDGLLACPAYFHNALLFCRQFNFIKPEKEAEILAIRKAFPQVSFKDLAWIVHLNCLRGKRNDTYEWKGERQVYPINKTLKKYFESKAYRDKVRMSEKNLSFTIDWQCYKTKSTGRG